ncbi:zf-C3HC4-domain-containing protein [Lentinus tigrinus ALCF2SS1-7]|uniref:Zf-C3HC4-domain-containing protein n=1 Tax=Lentinus tigrinus ALCF2SS1-6 TaxID=1328759 RepID=A0A5C2RXQ5_9APHY|nr:zf-C3HC4-domain-containing protein [Lentinus tigrinus ALCF2SS1-6]RPD82446.1 zf-C3HC4-domain-containing protein [Lentinus tigrinus ALCF2SS1-7]
MPAETEGAETKQCRICLDGEDPELGRLIRPCLCKGSISYVHVKCLQRWRNTSASRSAFYACPQCGYHYHFARTRVVGIATNPVVIAALSTLFFTILVLMSSFVTTYFMGDDDEYTYTVWYPYEVFRGLVRMTLGILVDDRMLDANVMRSKAGIPRVMEPRKPPNLLQRLFTRFLLGLPVVGAGSIAHLLMSIPMPFTWLRFRTRRGTRRSGDMVALIILAVVLAGAARALYKVYQLTERMTKRILLRAEDAILEVG